MLQTKVDQLFTRQVAEWDLAAKNYTGLEKSIKRTIPVAEGLYLDVQFNPERIYSSAAKVDPQSIAQRKCFLCMHHLPPQQQWVDFGKEYLVLVNPFPIFPRHLTIPHRDHTDQLISGRMRDMLELARQLPGYEIFYNGPRCGASAPDHFHFQAGNKGFMPLASQFRNLSRTVIKGSDKCSAVSMDNFLRKCIVFHGKDAEVLVSWFEQLSKLMQQATHHEPEPMMNIIASWENDSWMIFIFPRKQHRPWQFFEEGEKQILLSPASVDFGGVLITPREEDFHKLQLSDIKDIFAQITWDDEPYGKLIEQFSK